MTSFSWVSWVNELSSTSSNRSQAPPGSYFSLVPSILYSPGFPLVCPAAPVTYYSQDFLHIFLALWRSSFPTILLLSPALISEVVSSQPQVLLRSTSLLLTHSLQHNWNPGLSLWQFSWIPDYKFKLHVGKKEPLIFFSPPWYFRTMLQSCLPSGL